MVKFTNLYASLFMVALTLPASTMEQGEAEEETVEWRNLITTLNDSPSLTKITIATNECSWGGRHGFKNLQER